jgi:hypothetical protein
MKLRSTEDGSTTVIQNAKWVSDGWFGEDESGEKRFFPYGIWEDPDNPIEKD